MLTRTGVHSSKFKTYCKRFITLAACGFMLCLPQASLAQETPHPCQSVLEDAEKLFFNAAFDDAINFLETCLPNDALIQAEKAKIYLLLARIYYAKREEASAAEALENLFLIDPDYEPESHLPPPFVTFTGLIKEISKDNEELDQKLIPKSALTEERRSHNKRLLLIGGGGVLAITAVAIMSGGGSEKPAGFPEAPAPPGQ